MAERRKFIAGNWKMNGLKADFQQISLLTASAFPAGVDVALCPPATILAPMAEKFAGTSLKFGGQDCHVAASGAHTGDISARMLHDAGAAYVIVGHSERRQNHNETSELVRHKAEAALAASLVPIICVGETQAEREAGRHQDVVAMQLAASLPAKGEYIIAYEPVWAIGTGLTPSSDDIAEMHAHIRKFASQETQLLYGGSVKGSNAAEILKLPNIDGALVGGASLKAADFLQIIQAV